MNIFVYGPLMLCDVMRAVAGVDLERRFGTVNGYLQLRLSRESQAGLVPFPDSTTEGVLYMGVPETVVRRMDAFQGKSFFRGEVNVLAESGDWVEAETHFFRLNQRKSLSAKPWDEEEFRKKHLKQALVKWQKGQGR